MTEAALTAQPERDADRSAACILQWMGGAAKCMRAAFLYQHYDDQLQADFAIRQWWFVSVWQFDLVTAVSLCVVVSRLW